jgi:hypothetical protein
MGGKGYPTEGTYHGILTRNRSVTIVGNPAQAKSGRYLIRDARGLRKTEGYSKMNITHWSHLDKSLKPDHSCPTFLAELIGQQLNHGPADVRLIKKTHSSL